MFVFAALKKHSVSYQPLSGSQGSSDGSKRILKSQRSQAGARKSQEDPGARRRRRRRRQEEPGGPRRRQVEP